MTPLEIEILLYYYTRGDSDFKGKENPPQTDFINHLVNCNVLDENLIRKPIYKITDKGIVYAQGIQDAAGRVPLPVWTIPTTHT